MNEIKLPNKLVSNCISIVNTTHDKIGFDKLPNRITTGNNVPILYFNPDAKKVLKAINAIFKLQIIGGLIGIVIVIIAVIFSGWLFLGVIAILVFEIYLYKLDKESWKFLAAVLLSIEMLVDNFAGWGEAFHHEKEEVLNHYKNGLSPTQKTFWLDYYLKFRKEIDPSIIKSIGPN